MVDICYSRKKMVEGKRKKSKERKKTLKEVVKRSVTLCFCL